MNNITKETILYAIEQKILNAKKEKVNLLSEKRDNQEIAKVDANINSFVLIKSELIKENKSNEYHLSKEEELKLLSKMAKVREENIKTYKEQNRNDLLELETNELNILNEFLPKMPSQEELVEFISTKIDEYLASQGEGYTLSMRDMGKIKPIVTSVYSTIDGGMIKDVLMSKINN